MELTAGIVFNIQRFSVNDGPGIRTLVFFKGCPLHCIWCSNPESQKLSLEISYIKKICISCQRCLNTCPNHAVTMINDSLVTNLKLCKVCGKCAEVCPVNSRKIEGKRNTVDELYEIVAKDIVFFRTSGGGVTISGGEPYSQFEFLLAFLKKCKDAGISTAVETCGFVEWEKINSSLRYLDHILYDIKLINEEVHKDFTGVSNILILENLRKLVEMGADVIVRFPLIPGINDDVSNLNSTANYLKEIGYIGEIHLLPYHRLGKNKYEHLGKQYNLEKIKPPGKRIISRAKKLFEKEGFNVKLFG
jgi:pyruvate formate lyase activating enzyme